MAITEKMVTTFALRTALLKRLKEKQDALWDEILAELKKGEKMPETGPYTIALSQVGGKEFSWEDEYLDLLTTKLKKDKGLSDKDARELAEVKMTKLKEAAPNKKATVVADQTYVGGVKMSPKVNEQYKKAVTA
jgi:hypothetical protein